MGGMQAIKIIIHLTRMSRLVGGNHHYFIKAFYTAFSYASKRLGLLRDIGVYLPHLLRCRCHCMPIAIRVVNAI
jgi:hypothetical protein